MVGGYKLMYDIDQKLKIIDKTICDNISLLDFTTRGLVSENILSQSRNLVEHVALKIFSIDHEVEDPYKGIKDALEFIKHKNDYIFLRKFHGFLQQVASHYTPDEEGAERLILKYYEFYLQIKNYISEKFNIEILHNIDRFPINQDKTLQEYYCKISEKLDNLNMDEITRSISSRFYVQKSKPFFVNNRIYYENTLSVAYDFATKFDRFVAFSKFELPSYYAIKVTLVDKELEIVNMDMPVKLITDYITSIRPCELKNYAKIFNYRIKVSTRSPEYIGMMNYLSRSGDSLIDVITASDSEYQKIKYAMLNGAENASFIEILDCSRLIVQKDLPGCNVLRYLLYKMKNKIIKMQLGSDPYGNLSGLNLRMQCIPFDKMPYATSLYGHNPHISDIFACISYEGREHELLARKIDINSTSKAQLYTKINEFEQFGDINVLKDKYNQSIYKKHYGRRLETIGGSVFINERETETELIIQKILDLSKNGIGSYRESVDAWLEENPNAVDCEEKRTILKNMFVSSNVSLIYGAAGTGKSTLVNHVSQFFDNNNKLFLANTKPAVDNLHRIVKAKNCQFMTIAKFIKNNSVSCDCDILIMDECSMVSNKDMVRVLQKASFRLLILVGDIYQIEAITFGNWFRLARYFVPSSIYHELTEPYRTEDMDLLNLWEKVRKLDDDITEHMVNNQYSVTLDESIFKRLSEDEIILCLNYDGLYGINNINRFLQNSNSNIAFEWGAWLYKVGDPVLFNDTERFAPVIYNNLKGKITDILLEKDRIWFSIEIDKVINEFNLEGLELQLMPQVTPKKSVVKFSVSRSKDNDDDEDDNDTIVPFQVAYAVSIHKAQGLEYDSVKIVITEEVDEKITHNIFYTAITRTKSKLKVYWTPESQKHVTENFISLEPTNDVVIFSSRTGIKRVKQNR